MSENFQPDSLIKASQSNATPAFWFSAKRIRENYHRFTRGLPGVKIFFPPKVNPNEQVLKVLEKEGSNFEAASLGEIKILRKIGVSIDKIIFTSPVKSNSEISSAFRMGIKVFVVDSLMEIEKLVKYAPGSKVLVRIITSNKGSQWPLSRRFGATPKQAPQLLQHISDWKLIPYGLSFHVGSQCTSVQNWREAIRHCGKIIQQFEKTSGLKLQVLDIGGGFPVCYTKPIPSLENIFSVIKQELEKIKRINPKIEIWAEPGRAIVADSGFAVATVIGRTRRGRDNWLFCDLGVFNGLLELIEPSSRGFAYELYSTSAPKKGKNGKITNGNGNGKKMFTLTGPSCDGDDIIAERVTLPDLSLGDRIYFLKTGAYSLSYGSKFCGNIQPKVHLV